MKKVSYRRKWVSVFFESLYTKPRLCLSNLLYEALYEKSNEVKKRFAIRFVKNRSATRSCPNANCPLTNNFSRLNFYERPSVCV